MTENDDLANDLKAQVEAIEREAFSFAHRIPLSPLLGRVIQTFRRSRLKSSRSSH